MSVHEKIRLIREAKGLTQEEVAEKLEMSKNGYGDIERGNSDIKLSKLEKIAQVFDIQLSELVALGDKGKLNVSFAYQRNNKHQNIYIGSNTEKLKEQLLINEFKEKEIELLQREIEYLKKQVAQLEEINSLLKKQSSK